MSLPAVGVAQVDALPATIIRAASIGPNEQSQIDAFVQRYAPALSSSDYEEVKRARDFLLAPLEQDGFSVDFRQKYSQALWPTMKALMESGNPFEQLTGMRLAGQAATEQPTQALIKLLSSDDAGVRVFAAGRLGMVLKSSATSVSGISPETAASVARALGERVRADDELRVADASVRALGEATVMPPKAVNGLREVAIRELGDAIGARLRGKRAHLEPGNEELLVALRALGLVGQAVADATASPGAETAKSAVGAGGDAVAYILARFDADLIGEDKTVEVRVLRAAETALVFGRQRYAEAKGTTQAIAPTKLAEQLQSERPRDFRIAATGLLGPSSDLVREFGFKPDRFLGTP